MAKETKPPSGAYEVGYGRPPRANQFKPGQSGNPRGRPKRRLTAEEILIEELNRVVRVRIGERIEHQPKLRVLLRSLVDQAVNRDRHALRLALQLYRAGLLAEADDQTAPEEPLTPEELAVLRDLSGRLG